MEVAYYEELGYKVEYTIHEHHMDFKAYFCSVQGSIMEESTFDEDIYAQGYVKWDGCTEMDTDGNNHFCCLQHIINYGELLLEIYGRAQKIFEF